MKISINNDEVNVAITGIGAAGATGEDGLSISSISKSGSTVTITMSDDTTFTYTAIDGVDGTNGVDGDPFIYSDFTQAQLDALKGDQGDQGDTGNTGIHITNITKSGSTVTITMSDDTTYTYTVADGQDGSNGTNGSNGTDGDGWTDGSYNSITGKVTFLSNDGLGFVTGDLKGEAGTNGTNGTNGSNGTDGDGFTGGSYSSSNGIVTFTSNDGLGFSTTDLRANNYSHPSGDGNLHVPATSTSNDGKILTAGSTAGSIAWQDAPVSLPTQSSTTVDKYLQSNGTSASWQEVVGGGDNDFDGGDSATLYGTADIDIESGASV